MKIRSFLLLFFLLITSIIPSNFGWFWNKKPEVTPPPAQPIIQPQINCTVNVPPTIPCTYCKDHVSSNALFYYLNKQIVNAGIQCNKLFHFIKEQKQELLIGLISLFGMYKIGSIFYINNELQHPLLWSLWKYDADTDSYNPIKEDELMYEIQKRYLEKKHIVEFKDTIKQFFLDLAYEKKLLYQYETYGNYLHKLHLGGIIDPKIYYNIGARIERIKTLKQMCIRWISRIKVQQHYKEEDL